MKKSSRDINEIARATIEVAAETHAVARVIHDLKQFARDHEVGARMHPAALGAISALMRRDLVSSIDACVQRAVACARDIANHHEVTVTSAVALRSGERAELSKALAKRLDGTIALEEKIDATLLGGLVVETNAWRFDASVKGKIHQLECRMKNVV